MLSSLNKDFIIIIIMGSKDFLSMFKNFLEARRESVVCLSWKPPSLVCYRRVELRNEFHFSGVHGAMNRSGSRAK